jgi:pyruvate/2-oxoglutarate dehydrogenase complex dihydrolipoamide acyltransferase (E2) component
LSTEIKIPMLDMAMTEALLAEWLVGDGATVEEGTPIYSIESDKTVLEIESPAAGVLRILGETGTTYPVGEVIARIE